MLTHSFTEREGGRCFGSTSSTGSVSLPRNIISPGKNPKGPADSVVWFSYKVIGSSSRDYSAAWIVTRNSCVQQRPDADLHTSNQYLDNEKYKRKTGGEGLTDGFILPADELWSRIFAAGGVFYLEDSFAVCCFATFCCRTGKQRLSSELQPVFLLPHFTTSWFFSSPPILLLLPLLTSSNIFIGKRKPGSVQIKQIVQRRF